MSKYGFDHEALMGQFAEASARQGETLRKAVQDATLKALQGRELTLKNIEKAVHRVGEAAALGAGQNPLGATQMEALLSKAISGIDAALLQAVEANRRALQQLVEQGVGLRETQVRKAMSEIDRMEDMFFSTVRKAVAGSSAPMQSVWTQVMEKLQVKGSSTGMHAAQSLEQLTEQAQTALREGRAMGMKTMQVMLDSYAALASGVLLGLSEAMRTPPVETPAPAPAKASGKPPAGKSRIRSGA